MGKLFNIVMQIVSTLLGVLMVCMGGIWVLQGLDIALQAGSFMAGDPQWAVWGAILLVLGIGQVVWSITRSRPHGAAGRPAADLAGSGDEQAHSPR